MSSGGPGTDGTGGRDLATYHTKKFTISQTNQVAVNRGFGERVFILLKTLQKYFPIHTNREVDDAHAAIYAQLRE